jgi:hypothetical protein
MLVAAVLGPEEREDRQLEVVRLALEKFDDAFELSVGQPERTVHRDGVQWLFGDPGQVVHSSREGRRQSTRWNES